MTATTAPWRGIFTILCTPFTDLGEVDWRSLDAEVEFCLQAGAHGLVCSVNASEFWTLTEEERGKIARAMVARVDHKIPTVVGVAGGSSEIAVSLARAAEDAGADAVMAMPPTGRGASPAVIRKYYEALSRSVELPIFVQNHDAPAGTRMSPEFVSRLVNELEHVDFIKEETLPPQHAIQEEIRLCGDRLRGVMGGIAGRYLFQEHARGACGSMPACEMTDVHARLWETLDGGDEAGARALFSRLLPLLNYESAVPGVYKWVLKRRGVISSIYQRSQHGTALDEGDMKELEILVQDLSDLLRVPLPRD